MALGQGDRVVVQLTGTVIGTDGTKEPSSLVEVNGMTSDTDEALEGSYHGEQIVSTVWTRRFWVHSSLVFSAPELPSDPNSAWREVCADAIRLGDFDAAFQMLEAKLTIKIVKAFMAVLPQSARQLNEDGVAVSIINLNADRTVSIGVGIRK